MQDKWEKDVTNSKTANEKENASPYKANERDVVDTQLVNKKETKTPENDNVKEKYKLYKDKKADSIKAFAKVQIYYLSSNLYIYKSKSMYLSYQFIYLSVSM